MDIFFVQFQNSKKLYNHFFAFLYNKLKNILKAEDALLIISRNYYITQKYTKKILCK